MPNIRVLYLPAAVSASSRHFGTDDDDLSLTLFLAPGVYECSSGSSICKRHPPCVRCFLGSLLSDSEHASFVCNAAAQCFVGAKGGNQPPVQAKITNSIAIDNRIRRSGEGWIALWVFCAAFRLWLWHLFVASSLSCSLPRTPSLSR